MNVEARRDRQRDRRDQRRAEVEQEDDDHSDDDRQDLEQVARQRRDRVLDELAAVVDGTTLTPGGSEP